MKSGLWSDFASKLEHGLAFGTPKFYIVPYDKINHALVNLSYNCDVKSGLSLDKTIVKLGLTIYGRFSSCTLCCAIRVTPSKVGLSIFPNI